MDKAEIQKEMKMKYQELVDYLLEKYGKAQYNYFTTTACKTTNSRVSRTKEGLYCHHIDEDKAIMLCSNKYAIKNPFEYQHADRLVYCNVLEHLLLHIKIFEEPKNTKSNKLEIQGLGGVINFICPELNDRYNGREPKQEWKVNCFNLVRNNFEDYIEILKYFLKIIEETPFDSFDKETISRGYEGNRIDKIYKAL